MPATNSRPKSPSDAFAFLLMKQNLADEEKSGLKCHRRGPQTARASDRSTGLAAHQCGNLMAKMDNGELDRHDPAGTSARSGGQPSSSLFALRRYGELLDQFD